MLKLGPEGLEQSPLKAPRTPISENPGTESGTVGDGRARVASGRTVTIEDLVKATHACGGLSGEAKAQIVALIRSFHTGTDGKQG